MKKILFICKYNLFRSRIAEFYLKKINKNVQVRSAGIIADAEPLGKRENEILNECGIFLKGKPKTITYNDLTWADLVIIIAKDVPKEAIKIKYPKYKLISWNLPDVFPDSKKSFIKKIIFKIIRKTEKLNKRLKK